ncbi:MAG: hypothetical protein IPL32_14205 [Chloracidobacterium sp.]|nr:hypothetical protein [Chloracidobacterium sp.]
MTDRPKIKIVKKEEASAFKVSKKKRKKSAPRNAAREMVSTVSDWVADFKIRKSTETKAAFELFRASNPRPSES